MIWLIKKFTLNAYCLVGWIMLKIVNLGRTGLYVMMRGGALASLGGRSHWGSADEARRCAQAENIQVCDVIVRTTP